MSKNDVITVLKGPDRVRKRPCVVFGSTDSQGALTAVLDIVNVFVAEAINGFCTKISVTLCNDGSIKVLGNGRPMKLCLNENPTRWKELFCDLTASPRNGVDPNSTHNALFGDTRPDSGKIPERTGVLYACSVQFCSEFMVIDAFENGKRTTVKFEKGLCVEAPRFARCECANGNLIHFKLDKEVFPDPIVAKHPIEQYLNDNLKDLPLCLWEVKFENT